MNKEIGNLFGQETVLLRRWSLFSIDLIDIFAGSADN
jgi:hypothetical protein